MPKRFLVSSLKALRLKALPKWMLLSGATSGLMLAAVLLTLHRSSLTTVASVNASTIEPGQMADSIAAPELQLGPRHQLTYEQWVKILEREAAVVAESHPHPLFILAGDSLSLWFPADLLPAGATWLNQGISGETSYGLLHRVKFLDQTQPEGIFLLIGINDLIRGGRQETLLANQREIVRHFKKMHPETRIVVQSILPHGADRIAAAPPAQKDDASDQKHRPYWSDRLEKMPNQEIRQLNQRLAAMAQEEGVEYLDLHPHFVDAAGNLQPTLTSDGLHLSREGYKVWRSQLQQYSRSKPPGLSSAQ